MALGPHVSSRNGLYGQIPNAGAPDNAVSASYIPLYPLCGEIIS